MKAHVSVGFVMGWLYAFFPQTARHLCTCQAPAFGFLCLLILFLSKNKRTGNYGRTGHCGITVTLCLGSRQCTLLGRTGATLMILFLFFGRGGGRQSIVYTVQAVVWFSLSKHRLGFKF